MHLSHARAAIAGPFGSSFLRVCECANALEASENTSGRVPQQDFGGLYSSIIKYTFTVESHIPDCCITD